MFLVVSPAVPPAPWLCMEALSARSIDFDAQKKQGFPRQFAA
jgi:hypothetical protein